MRLLVCEDEMDLNDIIKMKLESVIVQQNML